jgi:AcrR family transcriptional regulator
VKANVDDVKPLAGAAVTSRPRRPYVSGLREAQRRRTRRTVVEAARDLFVERGYAATTIDAVAEAAGVSRKTVFDACGGKAALLKDAYDWAVVGDDEPVALSERPAVRAIQASTEPADALRQWVHLVCDVASRVAPIGTVLVPAADADPEAADLKRKADRDRLAGAQRFVLFLAGLDGLREGLTRKAAADVCWVYMDPVLYHRLVVERRWPVARYEAFLHDALAAALLP